MPKYIPFPAYADDAPVDLRFVYKNEVPAGKHGFLKADGDKFVFEDGTVGRFWGTNFNSGACFPSFDYSEGVALRLAKIGCNIVRFHQLDAEWSTPNIFQFTKGERQSTSMELDPESMKRLDYLVYCLKKNGIYVYFDLMTYRKFKSGDGVENVHLLKDAAKPYCYYDERLIELQKKFAYDFWTHVNPYTGIAYKDDPVFVMTEIVNEADFFSQKIDIEPYASKFRDLFNAWLKENDIDFDAYTCDLNENFEPLVSFKIDLMEKYYVDMYAFLRKIDVKIPITGTNWQRMGAVTKPQNVTDYADGHPYFYGWHWGEVEKRCIHKAFTQQAEYGFASTALNRLPDKPYFISEWDLTWPNEFRAESPLVCAAVGMLQGWSGYTIHTYAYGTRVEGMPLGKEVSSATIGGIPYREGLFSTWNDPAKFGLFYHAALITRRGDVKKSDGSIALKVSDMTKSFYEYNNLDAAAEYTRLGSEYDGVISNTATAHITDKDQVVDLSLGDVRSDTGELYRNWRKQYGTIDTPMTKVAYGMVGKNGLIELDGFKVRSKTDFAVIAASSLTSDDLSKTDNILLTTVGRAMNTDSKFVGDLMYELGRTPVLAEVIEAEISIKTENPDLKVWGINAEGFYVGLIPTTYEDGYIKFNVGEKFPSIYYLIRNE